jgi:hypothetical protein
MFVNATMRQAISALIARLATFESGEMVNQMTPHSVP